MGAVDTTYTFTATDTITSTKMNNIIDQTTITTDAIIGNTLEVASGKLRIRAQGITSNEMGAGSVLPAATTFADALLPSGAVMPFARNSAPSGWLAADGSSVSTSTYAALFAAIGYTYGGSGGSFNLPDLRGIFVRGSGSQTIGGITYNKTFASKENDSVQGHYHTLGKDGNPTYFSGEGQITTSSDFGGLYNDTGTSKAMTMITDGSNGTPRIGPETRPANIALLYCIKI